MTQEDIIRMAREAGLLDEVNGWDVWFPDELERFAKLVERRKCAELADKIARMPFGDTAASFAVWIREQA